MSRAPLRGDESGFTLIELLVVVLIIGLLAAIALPLFIAQRAKGEDADAKSNARNLVSSLEGCYAQEKRYDACETAPEVADMGLALGALDGEVELASASADDFEIVGHSKSGNNFTASRTGRAAVVRSCSSAGNAGCDSNGSW